MASYKLSQECINQKLKDGTLKIISHFNQKFYDVYDIYIDTSGQKYKLNGELIIEFNKVLKKEEIENNIKDGLLIKTNYLDIINHDYYEIYIDKNGNKYTLDGFQIM